MLETAPPVAFVVNTRQDATQRAPPLDNQRGSSLNDAALATTASVPTPTQPHPSYSSLPLPVADHAAEDRSEARIPIPRLQAGTEGLQKRQRDVRVLPDARPVVVNKPGAKSGAGSNASTCTGELCQVNPSPGKLNQKCSRRFCKACCQHAMRNSPDTEGRCALNHHNLARDTPEIDDDGVLRRRGRGPVPPPSALARRTDGDSRAIRLDTHAGYVALSWEKTLADSSWQRTPTDGLDARKERRALDSSVQVYWWLCDDEEPAKMSLRTHGHATFLPSTYADQMRRLVPDVPTDLSVFGAYNVEIGEWTQTELAQKIPYQRVLFLRSPCVRRTPGLEQRVSAQFKLGGATPSRAATPMHSTPTRRMTPTPTCLGRSSDSYEVGRLAMRDYVPDPRRMLDGDSGAQIVPEYGCGIDLEGVSRHATPSVERTPHRERRDIALQLSPRKRGRSCTPSPRASHSPTYSPRSVSPKKRLHRWSSPSPSPAPRTPTKRSLGSSGFPRGKAATPRAPRPAIEPASGRLAISNLLCGSDHSSSPPPPSPFFAGDSPSPPSSRSPTPLGSPELPEPGGDGDRVRIIPPPHDLVAVKNWLQDAGETFPLRFACDMILFFRACDFMETQQGWIPDYTTQQGRFAALLPGEYLMKSVIEYCSLVEQEERGGKKRHVSIGRAL